MLELYKKLAELLTKLRDALNSKNFDPDVSVKPEDRPMNQIKYLWDTPAHARHSIRVIGDEMGLKWAQKDLICAVIQAESGFRNSAKRENRNKAGKLLSTDWGVCQINDYFHVGVGKKWSSPKQIVDNPDKAVRWMIQMYKAGKLNLWVAYTNGSFRKFLPK